MTTERQAILERILAEPEDDTARLVFADWLEEKGDDFDHGWAELIRVQIAKSKLVEESPGWRKLDKLDRDLRDTHKKNLLSPFKGLAINGHVIRGFVERLTMHARTLMRYGEELFMLTPLHTVRFVTLSGHNKNEPTFAELLDSDPVGKLRGFDFEGSRITVAVCEGLAQHPNTVQIQALGMARTNLGDAELAALLRPGAWSQLTSLNLENNNFTPAGMRLLSHTPPARLKSICLAESLRSSDAVVALAEGLFPSLTHLELSGCTLTNAAVAALAKAPYANQLHMLALSTTHGLYGRYTDQREGRFGDAGLLALINSDPLRDLRSLNISGQALTVKGLRALLKPDVFPHMENLDLRGIAIEKGLQGELRKRYGVGVCRLSPP